MNPSTSSLAQRPQKRPVLSLVVSLLIVLIGSIQLLATVHTYAVNVGELNSLKEQQATLQAKKDDLENDIARWNDKAYVVSQARERLGFVFPGETSVLVLNSESVTGKKSDSEVAQNDSNSDASDSAGKSLPWYKELQYSFEQADEQKNVAGGTFQNGSSS